MSAFQRRVVRLSSRRPTFNLHAAGIGFHLGAQPGNIVNSPQIQAKVRQCESVVHLDVSGWYQ